MNEAGDYFADPVIVEIDDGGLHLRRDTLGQIVAEHDVHDGAGLRPRGIIERARGAAWRADEESTRAVAAANILIIGRAFSYIARRLDWDAERIKPSSMSRILTVGHQD